MRPGILVVSSHPAIDVEWRVARAVPEEKNLVLEERRWPGGKGINVTRWLKWLGASPTLLLPLGGRTGEELAQGLETAKISYHGVPLAEANRTNVVITQEQGPQYRFNAIRPRLSAAEARAFKKAFASLARGAALVVISGTLAPGLPARFYRELIIEARRHGCPAILDCDGEAFRRGIEAHPLLVKPNEFELSQWVGKPLRSEHQIKDAALALSAKTRGWVLVSRGADGALLAHQESGTVISQPTPKTRVKNTVGAGDAMVAAAAWAIARKARPDAWLTASLATAAVLVRLPAGTLPPARRRKPRLAAPK